MGAVRAALEPHNWHHRAITKASMDMPPAYIAGVKENLEKKAVDKLHFIAYTNAAVDQTRRVEQLHLDKKESEVLKVARWALLKTP